MAQQTTELLARLETNPDVVRLEMTLVRTALEVLA